MVGAELYRRQRGWVANPTVGFIGPGDSFTVKFDNKGRSLSGMWKGSVTPEFRFSPRRRGGMEGLTGVTRDTGFGDEIRSSGERSFSPCTASSVATSRST